MNKFLLAIMLFFISFSATACGFKILNERSSAFNSGIYSKNNRINAISGIYVKPFKNLTYKSGIGAYFSVNISNYLNTTTYMFTSNKSEAAYYLTGKIISIQNNVTSYTGVAAAVNYSITATVNVSLYRTDGRIIFRNIGFSSSASYFNYINPLIAHKQEKMALRTLSKRIARKIAVYVESKGLMRKK